MNPIRKAVDDVKFEIPDQILRDAFIPYNGFERYKIISNIDEQIINRVIKAKVLVDCNIIGGVQATIPLGGLPMDKPSPYETVIKVPKTRTQGKSITTILNVSFISPAAVTNLSATLPNYNASKVTGSLMQSMQALLASFDTMPVISTARADLISENVILVRDNIVLSDTAFLRCFLENDDELNNIQLRSFRHFSNLCVLAVKAYIYNKLVIDIDQARLQNGYELGAFKERVMEYADAYQTYKDYLNDVWGAVAFMNDPITYNRYMTLMIGSGK